MKLYSPESRSDSHREYLQTPEWRIKAMLMRWINEGQCLLCGSTTNPETHHKHYKRHGKEPPADLGMLCDFCHRLVTYLEKYGREDAKRVRELCRAADKSRIDLETMRGFWGREIEHLQAQLEVIRERVETLREMYQWSDDSMRKVA